VKEFQSLLLGKQADRFDQWRLSVEQSGLQELQSFSTGLMKDESVVRVAMTYDWGTGQVEGNMKIKTAFIASTKCAVAAW
jgi:transposase